MTPVPGQHTSCRCHLPLQVAKDQQEPTAYSVPAGALREGHPHPTCKKNCMQVTVQGYTLGSCSRVCHLAKQSGEQVQILSATRRKLWPAHLQQQVWQLCSLITSNTHYLLTTALTTASVCHSFSAVGMSKLLSSHP